MYSAFVKKRGREMGIKRFRGLAAILLLLGTAAHADTAGFTTTYKNTLAAGKCNTKFNITGSEPTSGTHPVFIYLVGTWESYDNAAALSVVQQMADRGYVAASVEYPNSTFGNCNKLSARSACIFDGGTTKSAISKLCKRKHADCSQGVVVGGFSQGSVLSILSANYDSRIQAVWALGAGAQYSGYDLSSCLADGNRTLSSDRLRVVNGQNDDFFAATAIGSQGQSEVLTGQSCGDDATSCVTGNGSGWILAQDDEVTDGLADHCYMRNGNCDASENTLDPLWETGSAPWAVGANLDWLQGFVP